MQAERRAGGKAQDKRVGKNQLMFPDVVAGIFWVQARGNAVCVHFSTKGVWGISIDLSGELMGSAGPWLSPDIPYQNFPANQRPGGTHLHCTFKTWRGFRKWKMRTEI